MKEKIKKFMSGRYGMDDFTQFLIIICLLILVFANLLKSKTLSLIAISLILFIYFRIFTKNISKAKEQNRNYLKFRKDLRGFFTRFFSKFKRDKKKKIFKCPSCKQKLSLPRNKGKIEIRCVKCNHKFIRRS